VAYLYPPRRQELFLATTISTKGIEGMKCTQFVRDGLLFWASWAVATISILFAPDSDAFPTAGRSLTEISSVEFQTTTTKRFVLTQDHVNLLRKLIIGWNSCESGAAGVDFGRTFGIKDDEEDWTPGLAKLMEVRGAGINGALTPEQVANLHATQSELMQAFQVMIQLGKLEPGKYVFKNCLRDVYPDGKCNIDATGRGTIAIPQTKIIEFRLTEEHLKLLHHGHFTGLSFDPKRPYGDMTNYEIDMADALGVPVPGKVNFSQAQLQHFLRLHTEMLYALQVFIQNAAIEPGQYSQSGYGDWQSA
jgi:hypothetical protein